MINIIFHLKDMETLPAPSNISHMLGKLDPMEKETEKRGGPVEKLESIKLDNQHPERWSKLDRSYLEAFGTNLWTSSRNTRMYLPGPTRTCPTLIHQLLPTGLMSIPLISLSFKNDTGLIPSGTSRSAKRSTSSFKSSSSGKPTTLSGWPMW